MVPDRFSCLVSVVLPWDPFAAVRVCPLCSLVGLPSFDGKRQTSLGGPADHHLQKLDKDANAAPVNAVPCRQQNQSHQREYGQAPESSEPEWSSQACKPDEKPPDRPARWMYK
jgi:hypothetical protein